jgi:hypothetical protein
VSRIPAWLRDTAVAALLCGLAVGVLSWLLPVNSWLGGLGPRLLQIWGLLALFAGSSAAFGSAIVRRLSNGGRRDGYWGLSFAAGLGCFGIAIAALGWMRLLNPFTFFALPLTMLAVGFPAVVAEWRERRADPGEATALSIPELLATAFGVICLFLLFLQVVDPMNVNFDARWYHLRVAERFALAGAMVKSPEGDQLLTLPQLASWIYTWAFMAPFKAFDDKLILALHLELATVIGTLMLIPPFTRVLIPTVKRSSTRLTWIALFFFPSIFIYDTGLMGGADHIVAVWGLAVPLALWQARERKGRESWILLGVISVGLLAKYTSVYLLVPLVPLFLVDWALRWRRSGSAFSPSQKTGPFLAAAVGLVLTCPYWLRNWIWYGNPVYPSGSRIFPNRPWAQDAAAWQRHYNLATTWSPTGDFQHRVETTLQSLTNYPLQPYTWPDMVEGQSAFGFSFLLAMVAIPFVVPRVRLVIVALVLNVSIAVWFNTHQHHMRYLTVAMPMMGCVAAAVAVHLWSLPTRIARIGVAAVVIAHLAAFADVPFRRTHGMNGRRSPVESGAEYLAVKGNRGSPVAPWVEMGRSLPPDAMPVVHGVRAPLGIGRQTLSDFVTLQFGLGYGRLKNASGVYKTLREMGGTHMVWGPASTQFDSIAGEALFYGVASRTVNRQTFGGMYVGELPPQPPDELGEGILYVGCALYQPGLYRIAQLATPIEPPEYPWPTAVPVARATVADWQSLLSRATYVVQENDCGYGPPSPEFERQGDQLELPKKVLTYYVRRTGAAQGWD